jgi:hypothetical protein
MVPSMKPRLRNHPPPLPANTTRMTTFLYSVSESIERFIEDQAVLAIFMIWLLPHLLAPLTSVSSTGDTHEEGERETTLGQESGAMQGGGRSHTTARKPGPLCIIQYFLRQRLCYAKRGRINSWWP